MSFLFVSGCLVEDNLKMRDFGAFAEAFDAAFKRLPEHGQGVLRKALDFPLAGVHFFTLTGSRQMSRIRANGRIISFNTAHVGAALKAGLLETLVAVTLLEALAHLSGVEYETTVEFDRHANTAAAKLGYAVQSLDTIAT